MEKRPGEQLRVKRVQIYQTERTCASKPLSKQQATETTTKENKRLKARKTYGKEKE